MNMQRFIPILTAVSTSLTGLAMAQDIGKVISSTPVLKRVTEPRSTCVNDVDGRQRCRTEMVTEDRNIGYKVVYEYAGKQHTVQLPFPPGPTIELEVTPTVQSTSNQTISSTPTPTFAASDRVYVEPIERVYREPVYVDRVYYPRPYYDYYGSPVYPLLGVALGYTWGISRGGYWGHGWHGHPRWR